MFDCRLRISVLIDLVCFCVSEDSARAGRHCSKGERSRQEALAGRHRKGGRQVKATCEDQIRSPYSRKGTNFKAKNRTLSKKIRRRRCDDDDL